MHSLELHHLEILVGFLTCGEIGIHSSLANHSVLLFTVVAKTDKSMSKQKAFIAKVLCLLLAIPLLMHSFPCSTS